MKKETKKQELVARPHQLLPFFAGNRLKIRLNRKSTKCPILLV